MKHVSAPWLVVVGVSLLVVACGSSSNEPARAKGSTDAGDAHGGDAYDAARDVSDGHIGDARDGRDASDGPADGNDAAAGCAPACTSTQACVAGACLPAPTQLAAMPGCGAAHLAVAGGALYWTEHATGAVKTLSTTSPGGAPTVVAANQSMPGPIAVDGANVYWSNDGDLQIMKAAGGVTPAPLVTAPAAVSGLVASGGTVYYGAGPSTYKIASTDTAPTTLMTFPACRTSRTGALALDVDHLYQTDYLSQYLTRERIDGQQMATDPCAATPATAPKIQAPDTISHSQGELFEDALAVVGGQIIWADAANLNGKASDATTMTGSTPIATTANTNDVTGFVVTGSSIYLGESGAGDPAGDSVEVAGLDPGDGGGATAVVLATGQPQTSQFVADATHVYWITTTSSTDAGPGDCAIMSLAK